LDVNAPDIDFAPHARTRRWIFIALLAAAAMGCAHAVWHRVELERAVDATQKRIQQVLATSKRAGNVESMPKAPRIDPARLSAVNGAISRLNIPWSELFAAFESSHSNDVALVAILPDAKRRVILVQAEARNAHAMVEFAERLRGVEHFRKSYLTKHERREQEIGEPFRFTVEVHWDNPP